MAQVLLQKTAAASIATPAAGKETLFIDTATNHLSKKDSSGTVTDLEAGASYTDADAIDAVGGVLVDTGTIDFTFVAGTISAIVKNDSITNSQISTAAAITYSKLSLANSIVNADVSSSAGISLSKLAALTTGRAVVTNGSGVLDVSSITATEIGYLTGVSSGIQTQIDGKQPLDSDLTALAGLTSTGMVARTATGAMSTRTIQEGTGITVTNGSGVVGDPSVALANTAVTPAVYGSTTQVPVITIDQQGRITNASNTSMTSAGISDFAEAAQDAVGAALTDTATIDFTYTDGSDQITADVKAGSLTNTQISATAAIAQSKLAALTASRAVLTDASGFLTTNAVTSTELGYLSGVTSAIQTQLNGKYPNPTGTTADYLRGDGSVATFPTFAQADRLVTTVRNQTGSTIAAGAVVYINGSSGTNPTITPALADSDINSAKTYGLTTAAIPDNATGTVVAAGRLQNINTSSFLTGASLYLSPTTPGGYTSTKPSAPDHLVAVGFVIRSHPTQGEIEVKIINGFELEELHDVAISGSPVTGQSLYYNSVTNLWSNQTPPMSITGQMAVSLETAVVALIDAATIAVDASLGNTFTVTLGGNRTLGTPTNPSSGQKIIVRATQDGTGGQTLSYSAGWNLGADFAGLSLSTTANTTDYIGAIYNSITSKWDIVSIMKGY